MKHKQLQINLKLAFIFCIAIAPGVIQGQETLLPELGSSAGDLITPEQEQQYGSYTLYQLRQKNYILDDPLIDVWLQTLGHRLGASSDNPKQPFTFFMVRDRQINAFATLGGYIGINAGLILVAKSEDEVAGVLSHEISHVTQKHVLRSVERASKDKLPVLLATLATIVVAQSSNSNSSNEATMAAVVGSQALLVQRQIDYTRSNESEADRIGIQTLYRASYKPEALADFFARMESTGRGNSGGYQAPDFLKSHPVTSVRISEARDRAYKIQQNRTNLNLDKPNSNNPLLPSFAQTSASSQQSMLTGTDFPWAKERLRVLSASSPGAAISEYRIGIDGFQKSLTDAQKYGLALAYNANNLGSNAEPLLTELAKKYPNNLWIALAHAEAAGTAKKSILAQSRYEQLLQQFPNNRAVIIAFAQFLIEQNNPTLAARAQNLMRPLINDSYEDVVFQRSYARACELSGNTLRASEAYAEVAFLNGRVDDAINQLTVLLENDDLDYYQRTRIEARIAAFRPISLELRRQGIRPEQQGG
ncbi:MAG: M48 family metallopeptidase [Arenimonas sp.]|nr:M48 family metallopeptidase [Arenimonas sp.]